MSRDAGTSTLKLFGAFAIVYILWGSTFLGIRVGIETIPPLYLAGARFILSGLILLAYARFTGAPSPAAVEKGNAAIVGVLMLCFGNGAVCWAEKRMDSGIASLFVASVPLWLIVQNWLWGQRLKPSVTQVAGLLIGLCGIAVLMLPASGHFGKSVDSLGGAVVLCGTFCWSIGTLRARSAAVPSSPWFFTGIQMTAGGCASFVLGTAIGEWREVRVPTTPSIIGLLYLIVFGSIVAYTAYNWLNRNTTPARLSTYAYVNPVVAVLLGAAFVGETITPRTVAAILLVVGAVVLLSIKRRSLEPRPVPQRRKVEKEPALECG